jgi:hypothetical protein
MTRPVLPAHCAAGHHRARRVRLAFHEGKLHSKCRDCGCDLVRTQATRRWYYSGPLGGIGSV